MRTKLTDKYTRLDRAFRAIDEDGDNCISRAELKATLEHLQLAGNFSTPLVETLYDFMDANGDGTVGFAEFSRVMTARDVMTMAPIGDQGFFAGGSAGMAGDRQLWAQGFGAREASIAYPAHARYAPLSEGD